jgi:Zn-dependent protease with chaperone function
VYYDAGLKNLSVSRGMFAWHWIVVGPEFRFLNEREKGAVLLHEAAHCRLQHRLKRILWTWLVFVSPRKLLEICQEQEYEADRFAAGCGYRDDLVSVFQKLREEADAPYHPSLASRIERLTRPQGA